MPRVSYGVTNNFLAIATTRDTLSHQDAPNREADTASTVRRSHSVGLSNLSSLFNATEKAAGSIITSNFRASSDLPGFGSDLSIPRIERDDFVFTSQFEPQAEQRAAQTPHRHVRAMSPYAMINVQDCKSGAAVDADLDAYFASPVLAPGTKDTDTGADKTAEKVNCSVREAPAASVYDMLVSRLCGLVPPQASTGRQAVLHASVQRVFSRPELRVLLERSGLGALLPAAPTQAEAVRNAAGVVARLALEGRFQRQGVHGAADEARAPPVATTGTATTPSPHPRTRSGMQTLQPRLCDTAAVSLPPSKRVLERDYAAAGPMEGADAEYRFGVDSDEVSVRLSDSGDSGSDDSVVVRLRRKLDAEPPLRRGVRTRSAATATDSDSASGSASEADATSVSSSYSPRAERMRNGGECVAAVDVTAVSRTLVRVKRSIVAFNTAMAAGAKKPGAASKHKLPASAARGPTSSVRPTISDKPEDRSGAMATRSSRSAQARGPERLQQRVARPTQRRFRREVFGSGSEDETDSCDESGADSDSASVHPSKRLKADEGPSQHKPAAAAWIDPLAEDIPCFVPGSFLWRVIPCKPLRAGSLSKTSPSLAIVESSSLRQGTPGSDRTPEDVYATQDDTYMPGDLVIVSTAHAKPLAAGLGASDWFGGSLPAVVVNEEYLNEARLSSATVDSLCDAAQSIISRKLEDEAFAVFEAKVGRPEQQHERLRKQMVMVCILGMTDRLPFAVITAAGAIRPFSLVEAERHMRSALPSSLDTDRPAFHAWSMASTLFRWNQTVSAAVRSNQGPCRPFPSPASNPWTPHLNETAWVIWADGSASFGFVHSCSFRGNSGVMIIRASPNPVPFHGYCPQPSSNNSLEPLTDRYPAKNNTSPGAAPSEQIMLSLSDIGKTLYSSFFHLCKEYNGIASTSPVLHDRESSETQAATPTHREDALEEKGCVGTPSVTTPAFNDLSTTAIILSTPIEVSDAVSPSSPSPLAAAGPTMLGDWSPACPALIWAED